MAGRFSMFGPAVACVLTALLLQSIFACDLIQGDVQLEVAGDGFHRTMHVRTNISSSIRLINCKIVYLLHIPHGAYIDVDRLSESLHAHCFTARHFNVEEPAGSSALPQLQPISIYSDKLLSKTFLLRDSFSLPVHLRYHPPSDGDTTTETAPSVVFDSPRLYLRCENNESLLADGACKNRVEKIPCECSTGAPRCPYIHLTTSPFTAEIPIMVADKAHSTLVLISTIVVVCLSFLAVIAAVIMSGNNTEID